MDTDKTPINPYAQPCKTCRNYATRVVDGRLSGFCNVIEDEVMPYWNGCSIWKPTHNPTQPE